MNNNVVSETASTASNYLTEVSGFSLGKSAFIAICLIVIVFGVGSYLISNNLYKQRTRGEKSQPKSMILVTIGICVLVDFGLLALPKLISFIGFLAISVLFVPLVYRGVNLCTHDKRYRELNSNPVHSALALLDAYVVVAVPMVYLAIFGDLGGWAPIVTFILIVINLGIAVFKIFMTYRDYEETFGDVPPKEHKAAKAVKESIDEKRRAYLEAELAKLNRKESKPNPKPVR